MLDAKQLTIFVIEPALELLEPAIFASHDAVRMVLGTAFVESELVYLDQKESKSDQPGPAYGLWGMERPTFGDVIQRSPAPARLVISDLSLSGKRGVEQLHGNLFLGAVMCRLKYYLAPEHVPDNPQDAAKWWKLRYNTPQGAGTIERALPWFERAWKV